MKCKNDVVSQFLKHIFYIFRKRKWAFLVILLTKHRRGAWATPRALKVVRSWSVAVLSPTREPSPPLPCPSPLLPSILALFHEYILLKLIGIFRSWKILFNSWLKLKLIITRHPSPLLFFCVLSILFWNKLICKLLF